MKLVPLNNNVIIRREEAEDKSKGGILLPDVVKEKPCSGEVLAVGPGKRDDVGERIPMSVKTGQRILFTRYGGNEIELDGEKYIVIADDSILGVIED